MKSLYLPLCILLTTNLFGVQKSATGELPTYVEICKKAVEDPWYFSNFRSMTDYFNVVECGLGRECAFYILKHVDRSTYKKLDSFRKLDEIGNPVTNTLPGVGKFSGTVLRYIIIADQISKLFQLPEHPSIAEIGAGFGGQCYILSNLVNFSNYYIYDVPNAELLIGKVLDTLAVRNVCCVPMDDALPEQQIDLFISNYAYSECSRETQIDYFNRVLKYADRGYVLYNQTAGFQLSPDEFVQLLRENDMNPMVLDEPVFSYTGNKLIIWDRTQR